jgi:signal transduction histidine kinase
MMDLEFKLDDVISGREWKTSPERGSDETRPLAQTFDTLTERLRMLEDARGRLLTNLVYEVGRPVGALQSAILALLSGADQDIELRRELLEGMKDEVERLHPLLDNLTRLHDRILGTLELSPQPTPLSEWLPRTVDPWREAVETKGLHWQVDLPLSLPTINLDPDRLAQVLGNLLSNALKYTPAGGQVWVSAGVKDQAVWIQVRDTGPGLSEEEQARIFEPFYRHQAGRRFPQGMGLGLTIAQDLVVAHGGRLEVHSQPGEGSQFTIWLPF